MKRTIGVAILCGWAALCLGDDQTANTVAATPGPAQPPLPRASRPRQALAPAPVTAGVSPGPTTAGGRAAADAGKFTSEAKWLLAGYNNNEVVYTIFITNLDSRILRCTTQMQGSYIEDGNKLPISDRQVTTILPNQPTQVGTWMDMDEKSGATYTVKCQPA